MDVLFDGGVEVHYGFLYLQPSEADAEIDLIDARAGQANGLCGAAHPGVLAMITGLHTGRVPVRVELLAEPPAPVPAEDWEDVVEVSVDLADADYALTSFDALHPLDLPAGPHRARWLARGMDAARETDVSDGSEDIDRYLLQLWPAPPGAEAVIRRGSEIAAYWDQVAAETVPQPRSAAAGSPLA
ncbi:hypothetical protein C8046_11500 [Serinibacter arcticus]|uniref:Uncharacterized protein n=1 Tax=Serinibacter arcticus TaxID=1655435 RepID=A0A2U1ZW62_9MICO|nr:hypothetical protein [Serinibacter arcticus]PWD51180.1 hypothetical protein C8046_11500 [Serinibacter arcticus]